MPEARVNGLNVNYRVSGTGPGIAFVKQVTTKPVVGVGRFTSPDTPTSPRGPTTPST